MRNKKGRCHPGRNPFRAKQHRRTQIGLTDSRYRIHILPDQSLQYAGFQVVGAKFKSFYKLSCYNPLPQILFHPLPCCENCPFVVSAKCPPPLQLTSSPCTKYKSVIANSDCGSFNKQSLSSVVCHFTKENENLKQLDNVCRQLPDCFSVYPYFI